MAGITYTLTCTVTLPSGVQFNASVPPTIQWPELNTTSPIISHSRNGTFVQIITLSPLHETHSGQYSCRTSYSLGGIISEVVTDEMNLTVISELLVHNDDIYLSYIFLSHAALPAPDVSV